MTIKTLPLILGTMASFFAAGANSLEINYQGKIGSMEIMEASDSWLSGHPRPRKDPGRFEETEYAIIARTFPYFDFQRFNLGRKKGKQKEKPGYGIRKGAAYIANQ